MLREETKGLFNTYPPVTDFHFSEQLRAASFQMMKRGAEANRPEEFAAGAQTYLLAVNAITLQMRYG